MMKRLISQRLTTLGLAWISVLSMQPQGRQLFIQTERYETNLHFTNHIPNYYHDNPVLTATETWELNAMGDPYAAPFSGGVWYDETDDLFKMWYSAGGGCRLGMVTCMALSRDGKSWIKPKLDVVEGTNIVDTTEHDCVSVILDKHESNPSKRFKMFVMEFNNTYSVSMLLKYSSDGIHWTEPVAVSGELLDRCAAYYDPFRGQYVLSLKSKNPDKGRSRNYLSHSNPELAVSLAHNVFHGHQDLFIRNWFSADDDEPRNPLFQSIRPQIYNHEAMAYEGVMLGYFVVWQGPENKVCDSLNIQKRNEILIGWSFDGFNWIRPNKNRFIAVSDDFNAWNAGNIQSVAGCPLIVGDSLYFYVSARRNTKPEHDSNFSTGLAIMRRDGFVSVDASSDEGYVTTPCHEITPSSSLYVNVDVSAAGGYLVAELIDERGNVLPGFSRDECIVVSNTNSTCAPIRWRHPKPLQSQRARVRFFMKNSSLFAYWFSPWPTGESGGYTAGGGPQLNPSGRDIPL